jgi:hypothetical protein
LDGEEPKEEKAKIARNRQIEALKKQIQDFKKENPDAKGQLKTLISRNESEAKKVQQQLDKGDFTTPEKKSILEDKEAQRKFPELYKKAIEAKDKVVQLRKERELRIAKQHYEQMTTAKKIYNAAGEVLNIPRSIMSSLDFSAPLRQGLFASVGNPKVAAGAFAEMFRMGASKARFDRWFHDVRESDLWPVAEKSKLYIADPHNVNITAREEAFMSQLAEKAPLIGTGFKVGKVKVGGLDLVGGSERAYVGYLNKLRWDLFTQFTKKAMMDGKTIENSPELYKQMANYINDATGRGNIGGKFEGAAPLMNSVLFSPRLIASRLNLLKNLFTFAIPYTDVPKEVRVAYYKDFASLVGTGLAVSALAHYGMGASVETDPRSSDFGKIRDGDTRFDIWGGMVQYIRLIAQITTGQTKQASNGKITELNGKGAFGQTEGDVMLRFIRGKLAPIPGTFVDLKTHRDVVGNKVTWQDALERNLMPLILNDLHDAYKDNGVKQVFKTLIPSTFGVGVSTYKSDSNTKTLPEVLKDNLRSEDTDRSRLKNYNAAGRDINDKEFDQYVKQRDAYIKTKVEKLFSEGVLVLDKGNVVRKKYDQLPPEEITKQLASIKQEATRKITKQLFGEEKKTAAQKKAEAKLAAAKKKENQN